MNIVQRAVTDMYRADWGDTRDVADAFGLSEASVWNIAFGRKLTDTRCDANAHRSEERPALMRRSTGLEQAQPAGVPGMTARPSTAEQTNGG